MAANSRFGDASTMTGAQLRALLESVGLTRRDLSRLADVNESTVSRWWSGQYQVPEQIAETVIQLTDANRALEDDIYAELVENGQACTYRSDDDLIEGPGTAQIVHYGASFHRIAAGRAVRRARNQRADITLTWFTRPGEE